MFSLRKKETLELTVDNESAFDQPTRSLEPVPGEQVRGSLEDVTDLKGGANEKGPLFVTNLRVIWCRKERTRTNISIGFGAVSAIHTSESESRVLGSSYTLHLLARNGSTPGAKLEFRFSVRAETKPELFTLTEVMLQAYDASRLYREVRLRGALVTRGTPILLRNETQLSRYDSVWNISGPTTSDLGVMTITNIRVIWHAGFADNFCVSVPFVQLLDVAIRENSRMGPTLVLHTSKRAGSIVLGFRLDDPSRISTLHHEICSILATARASPVLSSEPANDSANNEKIHQNSRVVSVTTDSQRLGSVLNAQPGSTNAEAPSTELTDTARDALGAYYCATGANGNNSGDLRAGVNKRIIFDSHLGLAVEEPPPGITLQQLWEVVT